jgi:hypothetical protein
MYELLCTAIAAALAHRPRGQHAVQFAIVPALPLPAPEQRDRAAAKQPRTRGALDATPSVLDETNSPSNLAPPGARGALAPPVQQGP